MTLKSKTKKSVRLDRWLWAARFCKTRAIAKAVVTGGRVHVNGVRARPSRGVHIGDQMIVSRGEEQFDIVVSGLSTRRGPAAEAATLYQESEQSLDRREKLREQKRLERASLPERVGRPDKRDRKKIVRFTRKREI
ncbi:MAG: RNA-binding S4 domain-containing protein [Gammaproteobacteria bacterium]